MKVSWEKLEGNVGMLTVEVETEQVNAALDKAFRKIVGKVNVPGFRRGKVPRHIFEARFGVESLYQDALEIILPDAYTFAVKETGIDPIDRPEIDIVDPFGKNRPFKFTAKVQVKPEVTLGEYKGLEYEPLSTEVTPEEIDAELKRLQERHAEIVPVEDDSPAAVGDIVAIDFEGFVDGEPFPGGKGEKSRFELGRGGFIPGFEDGIAGMKAGEEKDVEVTFPEDYHAEHLKGKKAVFKVTLRELKRKVLPELDDEFAMDVSEFETLDEFKQDLEKSLKSRKEDEARAHQERQLIDQAGAGASLDIPEVMVRNALDGMVADLRNRLRLQGLTLERYFEIIKSDENALREEYRPEAERRVRNALVLEAIAKRENLEPSEEDVARELERLAEEYRVTVEDIREYYEQTGRIDDLREQLMYRRVVEFLAEHSKAKAG